MQSLYYAMAVRLQQGWKWLQHHSNPRVVGQGLVEYALILVLIAIVVIGAVTMVGQRTSSIFSEISCSLNGGPTHTDNGQGNSNRCK